MIRKSCLLLCVLSLTAFTAAGCGSDDKKSDSSSTPATPAATTDTPVATTDTPAADTGNGTADAAVQAAVDQCKASIDANAAVKDDIKPDLEKICEKAASGDANAAKEATKAVCLKIVESQVPSGAAQDQAKQACNAAG